MTKEEFIKRIAAIAVKDWNERHIMLPSVVIAQCCKESAFGTSELAVNANALCGIKLNGWTGRSYLKKAEEQNADGSMRVDPNALWRAYDSWEDSVVDHNTYISTRKVGSQTEPNFKDIIGSTNVKEVIAGFVGNANRAETLQYCTDLELREFVRNGKSVYPYATGLKYPQSLLDDYVSKYNLTQYDPAEVKSINILTQTSTNKTSSKQNRSIEYIVIHYTAGTTSKAGSAANIAKYFANSRAKASADFIVDDGTIVQYNPDIKNRYTWHCGGSKYNTQGGSYYGRCTNENSIGIEICSNNSTGTVPKANDPSWYFSDAAISNAKELVAYLIEEYGIMDVNVIRHYDVTGKLCPGIIGWNLDSGDASKWIAFKNSIQKGSSVKPAETSVPKKLYRVQVGAFKNYDNSVLKKAQIMAKTANTATPIVPIVKMIDGLYKVQCGAFAQEENAKARAEFLKSIGETPYIYYG